jgi:spartin
MSDDPQLLYSVEKIKAYHIQDGEETDLTPSGPQTMSLLMVPVSSEKSSAQPAEDDCYLHLNLPPEVDLALMATTRIYPKRPCSYLIRNPEPESGSRSYTRIEFPPLGRGALQEDIDTFETILAQCTAFMERAPAPEKAAPKYNPSDFKPGQAYAMGTGRVGHGQVILVDEENGSVVGEIAEDAEIFEDPLLTPGDKGKAKPRHDGPLTSSRPRRDHILLRR